MHATTSSRLSAADVLNCFHIAGECRELGADSVAWQTHLAERVRALLNAQVVIVGNTLHLVPGSSPVSLSTIRVGWRDDAARLAWRDYADNVPMQQTPEYSSIMRAGPGRLLLSRDEIWHDDTDRDSWYRSRTYNERHLPSGIDDYILSIVGVPRLDLFHSLWVHRAVGDQAFSHREREILSLLHNEIASLIGRSLASDCEPPLHSLTRRQRDALDALLTGDSEKQIAARLGVSFPTAHEYVASVYRHYKVSSRAELMARFVGRAAPVARPAPLVSAPAADLSKKYR